MSLLGPSRIEQAAPMGTRLARSNRFTPRYDETMSALGLSKWHRATFNRSLRGNDCPRPLKLVSRVTYEGKPIIAILRVGPETSRARLGQRTSSKVREFVWDPIRAEH